MTKYSADQPIIKGADVIYRPGGNAGEYAPLATNPYKGCGHECLYCYVPLATHIDRKTFNEGAILRPGYLDRLRTDAARHRDAGLPGTPNDQIFITFSSDPWHLGDTSPTRQALEILIEHDLAFCTLSKGGTRALRDLDLFRRNRDAFAVTLTSLDGAFSKKWERKAALPYERIEALMQFHRAGIFTWVSLEPTLDVESSLALIDATHEYVDLYKVGKANYLKEITRTTDWERYTLRVIEKMQALDKKHYIKADLQGYLPPGYANPLRVTQHH